MPAKFKNNATGTLAASINSSVTSVVLSSTQGTLFPTLAAGEYFYGTLFNTSGSYEIVKVTARAGDTLTVIRGQEGTTAIGFSAGDGFAQRLTAAGLTNFAQLDSDNTFSGTVTLSAADITGGSIDGTPVGASTPDTGDFTDLSASGAVSFTSTSVMLVPKGTTAQRPLSPANGEMRYNTDTGQFEGYQGGAWGQLGGGATGGGGDEVFVENSPTVTTSYTLSTGKNAVSVGPITINSGVTVTVPSGQRWVVL